MKPFKPLLALSAATLLAGSLYFIFRAEPQPAAAKSASAVKTAADRLHYPPGAPQLAFLDIQQAAQMPLPVLDPLPARIAYDEDATVRVASPITGRVLRILVQAGDTVTAGQPLAELDAPDFAAAQADLHKAEADLGVKRAALARARTLHEAGVIATKDFEAAQGDARMAEAETARAAARLHNLGPIDAGHYTLRAPLAGIVADRHINPGQEVRPDLPDPLFTLTDPARLNVVTEVSESDLARIAVGQSLRVEVDAEGILPLEAHVVRIGSTMDPTTRRVAIRAVLDKSDPRLKAEMFARSLFFDRSGAQVVVVPNTAVITTGLHSYVFVETEPGTLVKRRVSLALRGHISSYVKDGLNASERIVTRGALLLDADIGGEG